MLEILIMNPGVNDLANPWFLVSSAAVLVEKSKNF